MKKHGHSVGIVLAEKHICPQDRYPGCRYVQVFDTETGYYPFLAMRQDLLQGMKGNLVFINPSYDDDGNATGTAYACAPDSMFSEAENRALRNALRQQRRVEFNTAALYGGLGAVPQGFTMARMAMSLAIEKIFGRKSDLLTPPHPVKNNPSP